MTVRLLHVTDICGGTGKEFIPADAMFRGRYVHAACHELDVAHNSGALLMPGALEAWMKSLHEPYVGFVKAWMRCSMEMGVVVIASEEPITDERRGYCGTRDKRVLIHHRRGEGVIDLKCDASCSGAIPETTGLQTAGYVGDAKLWRGAVALHPDGTYRYHDDKTTKDIFRPTDWREFCARAFVMQQDIARGWREAPAAREE